MNDYVGQQFGNYRLIKRLGVGGFGAVYLAEHIHLGTEAAIKILDMRLAGDELEHFKKEARMLARLEHPNIIRVLDFGIEGSIPYLVMPNAPKGTLANLYHRGQQYTPQVILAHVLQTASALQHAHNQGYIHRDVKPQNLLVGKFEEVLLSDFGISMLMQEMGQQGAQGFVGTLAFAAPEQFLDNPCQASDQYALGTTIYQWLTGDLPFAGGMMDIAIKKINEYPPSPRVKVPALSSEVAAVVLKSLATKPEDRFPNVQAFAEAFEQACYPQQSVRRSSASTAAPETDRHLGNYRLLRLIGEGAFAEVYLGEHIHLKSHAAVKLMKTRLTGNEIEAFRQEAKIIADLQHPHIVRLLDFGIDDGTAYLVVTYAPNGTLRSRHPLGEQLSPQDVLVYLKEITEALQYIHNQRLIHRDIKPENLLIGPDSKILLTDFGMATMAHSTRSLKTQEMAGTFAYMAPEQIAGQPRQTSDQYSLAVVVYEWLTGEQPFRGSYAEIMGQHMFAPPAPLHLKAPSLPSLVEQVVLTALAKNPKDRFASITAFATAFEQAIPPLRTGAFISYSHKDKAYLEQLRIPLDLSLQGQKLEVWDDTMIEVGTKWRDQIKRAIQTAKVAVLLVSNDFLRSKFIRENELPPLLAAAEREGMRLIPVLVRPCLWELLPELEELQALNQPSKTVSEMSVPEQERLWMNLAARIRDALKS